MGGVGVRSTGTLRSRFVWVVVSFEGVLRRSKVRYGEFRWCRLRVDGDLGEMGRCGGLGGRGRRGAKEQQVKRRSPLVRTERVRRERREARGEI